MEYESTELNRNIKIKCEPIYDEDSLEIIKIEDEIFMQSIKIEKEEIQECYHNYLPEDNRQIMKIAGVEVLVEGHLLNLNLKPTLEIQRINLNLLEGVVKTEPNHKPKKRKIYQKLKKFQCEFCKKIMSRPSLVVSLSVSIFNNI